MEPHLHALHRQDTHSSGKALCSFSFLLLEKGYTRGVTLDSAEGL